MKALIASAAFALLAGCASQPAAIEMSPEPGFTVAYTGGLGERAQEVLAAPPEYTGPAGIEGTPVVRIETRIVRLSAKAAEALLGKHAGAVGALALDGTAVDELLSRVREREDCSLVGAPMLSVFEGQVGTISVSNEIAFVSGYELREGEANLKVVGDVRAIKKRMAATRIADPVVSTIQDGILLGVQARAAEAGWDLELDLSVTELLRPIGQRTVHVFGQPMTVQVPVMMSQRIRVAGTASTGRTLALTGMVGADNHVLLVLVTVSAGE